MRLDKPGVRARHYADVAKEWVKNNWKYHLVDSTFMLASTHPLYIAFEVNAGKLLGWVPLLGIEDVSDDLSLAVRMKISKWSYCGLVYAYTGGNNLSRKFFGVTDKSPERKIIAHDALYTVGFNAFCGPLIYYASGARDIGELATGTIMAMSLALPTGPIMKYAAGAGRDLMGLETFERKTYPDLLRRQNSGVKKVIAGGLVAASIGAMSLIYFATDDKFDRYETPAAQQVSEISDVVENGK